MNRSDAGLSIVMAHSNINSGGKIPMTVLTEAEQRESAEERKKRTGLSSLEISDQAAAAVQKTEHRVTLDSIKQKIEYVDYIHPDRHRHMTICLVTMENGFISLGQSVPADPGNFDAELGARFAYEDAVRKLWPLEAYLLCELMSK